MSQREHEQKTAKDLDIKLNELHQLMGGSGGAAARALGEESDFWVWHRPGWTTPQQVQLVTEALESLIVQARGLQQQQTAFRLMNQELSQHLTQ